MPPTIAELKARIVEMFGEHPEPKTLSQVVKVMGQAEGLQGWMYRNALDALVANGKLTRNRRSTTGTASYVYQLVKQEDSSTE